MKKNNLKRSSKALVLVALMVMLGNAASAQHFFKLAYRAPLHVGHLFGFPRIYPSIGFRLGYLPVGFFTIYVGGYPYYYYDNVYYRRTPDNYYEVVAPPLGAKLPQLPANAKPVVIDGKRYYESGGTFYREELNANNQVLYTVVGVNGVLNQAQAQPQTYQAPKVVPSPQPSAPAAPAIREPQIGDIVTQLPDGSQPVYLNGQKFYESPSNVYYEETIDNGKTLYKIVGK